MKRHSRSLMPMGGMFVLGTLGRSSFALVYTGGLDHTVAPEVDPGWDNVCVISIGSGAYLGDGWVLAPYHVYQHDHPDGRGTSRIVLNRAYCEIPGTAHRIEYSSCVDTDLVMFRIDGNPALALIDISNTAPLSQEVTVIATGQSSVGERGDFGDGYIGFETEPTRAKRWGRTNAFMTYFDSPDLGDDKCQIVSKDSGGSTFVERSSGGSWQLAEIALAIGMPGGYTEPDVTYT